MFEERSLRLIAGNVMRVAVARAAGMRWIGIVAVFLLSVLVDAPARATQAKPWPPRVGEQHEITRSYENTQQGSDGSTGSSRGHDAVLERVVAVTKDAVELEYDLVLGTTAEDRARVWMLPARVLRQYDGAMQLLNAAELELRLKRWLTAAKWTRAMCGRWVFTWNAFLIECDPTAVIKTIETFDVLSADLQEGDAYQDPDFRGSGTLRRLPDGPDGKRLVATMQIDAEAFRQERAKADVTLGEIMQSPVTLEAALAARARERLSGTIEVTIDTDLGGKPFRRTSVAKLEIIEPDGVTQKETRTVTVERRPVAGGTRRRKD